ncbi:MAG: lipid-binding SYLF domain-containing protein [Desulfosarcinaceae bacterium]|nr:lipid-binding SYLF domain-containing protein [Desulfosarcinaceae bacterium]
MKWQRTGSVIIALALLLISVSGAHADRYVDTMAIFKKSETVQPFFEDAYGWAVFPVVGKGGFVIGGAYGQGRVYRGAQAVGETSLVKATIGLQAGGQAFSQIIFFQDKRAFDEFTSGSFEFDATASAVAITAGVQAKAGTQGATAGASAGPATGKQAVVGYHKGMAVFIHAKGGLMYEATVGGQKFSYTPLSAP